MFKVYTLVCFVGYALAAPSNLDFAPLNEFSLKLLHHTFAYQENFGINNVALSPVTVWNIFSLLAEGSSGQTFQELSTELRLPRELHFTQALHKATSRLLKTVYEDVTVKSISAMYVNNSTVNIQYEFCCAATSYDTKIYFCDTSDLKNMAEYLNDYLSNATDGLILNTVTEENLKNLLLVLVDVLYFKANWTIPFDPTQTKREDFYDYQGKTIGTVNMMYQKAPHRVADIYQIQAQVLEMSYGKNEQFSMLILLPFDGTSFKQLLENLATKPFDWINDLHRNEELSDIDVYIPRFKIFSNLDLIPPLQYSGIRSIFDMKKAELPGVSDTPLYVTSVKQNVGLEVTEEGTVAAAATVVGLEDRFLGNRFEANRNFAFLIIERKNNLILFAGVYQEPSEV